MNINLYDCGKYTVIVTIYDISVNHKIGIGFEENTTYDFNGNEIHYSNSYNKKYGVDIRKEYDSCGTLVHVRESIK